jgi:hypothetical protein
MPVNTTETWADHFSTRSWATPADQVSAGYPIFIQPTTTPATYVETFDYGTVLSSSLVTLSYSGTTVAGSVTVTPKIETSANGSTWSSNDNVTSVFATAFRYVRITITVAQSGDTGVYTLDSLAVRLDAKLKNDAGTTSAVSTDASGTIANFNVEFIDVSSITVTPGGTSAAMAVYDFQDATLTGTYSITSNTATVNVTAHGLIAGQKVRLAFTTGTAPNGIYTVATASTNSFTATVTTANTSGNVSLYPQSMRIYLFNTSGTRVSGTASWAIKGY